ncbi:hypothetical protein BDV12DRAFT_204306 [Aspergillus spectabilis]
MRRVSPPAPQIQCECPILIGGSHVCPHFVRTGEASFQVDKSFDDSSTACMVWPHTSRAEEFCAYTPPVASTKTSSATAATSTGQVHIPGLIETLVHFPLRCDSLGVVGSENRDRAVTSIRRAREIRERREAHFEQAIAAQSAPKAIQEAEDEEQQLNHRYEEADSPPTFNNNLETNEKAAYVLPGV